MLFIFEENSQKKSGTEIVISKYGPGVLTVTKTLDTDVWWFIIAIISEKRFQVENCFSVYVLW